MGWGSCGEDSQGRPIGYSHEAICDYPGCNNKIDRGLSYACGGMHGFGGATGNFGCEKYFCPKHLIPTVRDSICSDCYEEYKFEGWQDIVIDIESHIKWHAHKIDTDSLILLRNAVEVMENQGELLEKNEDILRRLRGLLNDKDK